MIKKEVLADIKVLVNKLNLEELSAYNRGYLSYKNNLFNSLVLVQLKVWDKIVDFYAFERKSDCKGIIDVGTFIPYYPAVLKKIGYQVEVVEKINLYGEAFEPISDFLNDREIKIHDLDIVEDSINDLSAGYDVLLIAILEHLNGTPRLLLNKIKNIMDLNSLIFIEVPNICNLLNILKLVRGKTIMPPYEDYYFSEYPFAGHNREMTLPELITLCEYSSFEVIKEGQILKSADSAFKIRAIDMIKRFIPKYTDSVYVIAKKGNE